MPKKSNDFELLFLGTASGWPLNLEEPFTKLPHWKVKRTILTHFLPGLEKKENSLIAMAKKYGVKNFKLAKDGMRVK